MVLGDTSRPGLRVFYMQASGDAVSRYLEAGVLARALGASDSQRFAALRWRVGVVAAVVATDSRVHLQPVGALRP